MRVALSKSDTAGDGAMSRPTSTHDLRPSEYAFVTAMQQLRFGRFESVQIRHGELILDPWPTTIRGVKFGSEESAVPQALPDEFDLKLQVVEFFEYVRAIDEGEIRRLDIRHSLPFAMEVAQRPGVPGGSNRV